MLPHADFSDVCADMLAGQRAFVANDENWGFASEHFEEQLL
jgi:hypothetical protein